MARARRINEAGNYHHITARGVDQCPIFLDDGDRRQFLALLRESHERFGCKILAFCLMDNHIHLTVLDAHGTLSRTLHLLNGVYAKRFNIRHGRTGHLFERRFWSSVVDTDEYLATCVKYVHRNPIEAGMVHRVQDHRWSSYPSYIGMRAAPTFLDMSTMLDHYGNDRRQLQYATEQASDDSLVLRQLTSNNPPAVLGRESRVPATQQVRMQAPKLVPMDVVIEVCAAASNVEVDDVLRRTPGRRNETRGLVAFVAHQHLGHSLRVIATALNLGSSAAASQASRRFAERLDAGSTAQVEDVLQALTSI